MRRDEVAKGRGRGKSLPALAAGAAVLCLLLGAAGARALKGCPTHPAGLAVPRGDLPGLPNFARVSDGLYRGAQPTREGFEGLKAMGVRTVINLRNHHSDAPLLADLGFRYVEIPCDAWRMEDAPVVLFLKLATDEACQPVFVHCQHGSDRTGIMVAAYRVVVQDWDPSLAEAELPNFGFHPVFLNLSRYVAGLDGASLRAQVREMPDPMIPAGPRLAQPAPGGLP
ncbi:MAG: fused DSP-PTPase phosphatase/NAD kinase-like protein [Acidobacteriota bacterium]